MQPYVIVFFSPTLSTQVSTTPHHFAPLHEREGGGWLDGWEEVERRVDKLVGLRYKKVHSIPDMWVSFSRNGSR